METPSVSAQIGSHQHTHSHPDYLRYLDNIRKATLTEERPVFRINPETCPRRFDYETSKDRTLRLRNVFLSNIDPQYRQIYNCRTCLDFIDHYGGLIIYDSVKGFKSLLWGRHEPPEVLKKADAALKEVVENSYIQEPFFHAQGVLGTPRSYKGARDPVTEFHHFSCHVPPSAYTQVAKPHELIAQHKEEYRCLRRNLGSYSKTVIEDALAFVETCSSSVYSAKAAASFMLTAKTIHEISSDRKDQHNALWAMCMTAPKAVFHLNSTIYGVILDSFAKGVDADRLKQQLNIYQDPTKYRRPTAAPTSQLIQAATTLVNELGLADALPRRFAEYHEIPDSVILWSTYNEPKPKTDQANPFGDITPKGEEKKQNLLLSEPQTTSLRNFIETILPLADKVALYNYRHFSYGVGALTAPDVKEAPPIFYWDIKLSNESNGTCRNPFGHFVFNVPQRIAQVNPLIKIPSSDSQHYPVEAIILLPPMWYQEKYEGDYAGYILYLKDAKIQRHNHNGLFPAFLPSHLNKISSVIEAYASKNLLKDTPSHIAGVFLTEHAINNGNRPKLLITRGRMQTVYEIVSVK